MKTTLLACAAGIVAIAAMPAAAQEPGSRQTREFVQAAAQSDQFEILEAQAVLAQSTDRQVRGFAEQMIRDHGQLRAMLQAAAVRAGLQPPVPSLSGDQAQLLNALQSLRGPEFDRTYMRHQALAHRSALVVEQGYATNGDVPGVRPAAATATPMISSHLAMAEEISARIAGS